MQVVQQLELQVKVQRSYMCWYQISSVFHYLSLLASFTFSNSSARNGSVCERWQLTCVCRPRRLSRPGPIHQLTPALLRYSPCRSISEEKWAVNLWLWLCVKMTRLTAPYLDEDTVKWWSFAVGEASKSENTLTWDEGDGKKSLAECLNDFFTSCCSIRLPLSPQQGWNRVEDNHLLIFQISHPNHNTHQTISPYN